MAATTVVLGVTFWYGALLAINGDMTTGELNAFILYSINSAFGVALVAGTFVSIVQALGASTRVFELLDRDSQIKLDGIEMPGDLLNGGNGNAKSDTGVAVTFTDVKFAYPSAPERHVLKGKELSQSPRSAYAIAHTRPAKRRLLPLLVQD